MAAQRFTVATFGGESVRRVEALFRGWQGDAAPDTAVERFCQELRVNSAMSPVLYISEWVDRWLMGNRVPGAGAVSGNRSQDVCLSPAQALAWAGQCGNQFPEEQWPAQR